MVSVVSTRGLTKTYPGVTALDGLDLDLDGGLVGLVGANGAGKSTLFKLLLGLLRPTAGTVEVCGVPVASDPVGARSRLGYMPEVDCLPVDQSAADAVATFGELGGLPPRAARQRASEVLDLVGLDEARFRPVGGFSTGMRQRTKLAQALVADPALVLLDEPTAGLDPAGREEMLELVRRLGGFGIAVVMATHLLEDVVQTCDEVLMLDAGRLVSRTSTDSLVQRTGVVSLDVGPAGTQEAAAALRARGLEVTAGDGALEVVLEQERDLDVIRDVVADLGLPLHRLSSRLTQLDELFQPAVRP